MFDAYYSDACTIFNLCPEQIILFVEEKNKIDEEIDKILLSFDNGNNLFIANQIADYICNNATYNVEKDSSKDILWTGEGNCNAFALLFHAMCNRVNIKCDLLTGYANGEYHAWNRIMLEDGSYRYYDLSFYEYSENYKYIAASSSHWEIVGINRYLQ